MKSTSSALCHAAVTTANNLRERCIITPTVSGVTARVVSKFKPRMDIIGVTPNEAALRRMQLYWGIIPLKSIPLSSMEDVCSGAIDLVCAKQMAEAGDIVVLTAGIPAANVTAERGGASNIMRITACSGSSLFVMPAIF